MIVGESFNSDLLIPQIIEYEKKKFSCGCIVDYRILEYRDVLTDEQTRGNLPELKGGIKYMVDVASTKNGVGYRDWVHIDGFSTNIVDFITANEKE